MTAPRDTPSAGIDPAYAWSVGDRWLIDRDGDELKADCDAPHLRGGGAEAEVVFEGV